jgi:hypothetical protein
MVGASLVLWFPRPKKNGKKFVGDSAEQLAMVIPLAATTRSITAASCAAILHTNLPELYHCCF